MEKFIQISPKELPLNIFETAEKTGLLLAGDEKKLNSMQVDNILMGRLWDQDVIAVGIKPLKYTKEFVDLNPTFSVNIFDDSYSDEIKYIGSCSGRDVNKMAKSRLLTSSYRGTPFYPEAKIVIFCKKVFAAELHENAFLSRDILNKYYIFKDFHTIYISEIERVFIENQQ